MDRWRPPGTVPQPFHGISRGGTEGWEGWLDDPRLVGKTWFLVGAGASLLSQPVELLAGQIVYGINWTLRWFAPTFLQLVDEDVIALEVTRNAQWPQFASLVQLVSSNWAREAFLGAEGARCLPFQIHHHDDPWRAVEFHWARTPSEPMAHYENSLGWALNVASWFRPRQMVLLGFDFGGPHFFGDGAAVGSLGQYGLDGDSKPMLMRHLAKARDHLAEEGIDVVVVGASRLPFFRRVERLDTIVEGLGVGS